MANAQLKPTTDALTQSQKDLVAEQLERLLASKLFRDTTRMKRFLRYVTEEVLGGRGKRLKGYTIGIEVFDRADDFDPQADTIVRVQAGQLRRRLDLYYAGEGVEDPVRITVPKGRYAPCFEFRSDAPALPEAAEPEAKPLTRGATLELLDGGRQQPRPGLAVFTFDDLTPDRDGSDFFAEGLTAEVVGALVQFRHLRVIAVRPTVTSVGADIEVREIGRRFDAQFILSGNVRRAGDVFRVVVNLIDTKSGQILFQHTFDREYAPDTIFEIQENIASYVASAIAAPFGQINRFNWRQRPGRRTSLSAYEAVLRYYGMGLSPRLDLARDLLRDIEQITEGHETFGSGFAIRALLHVFFCTQCIPAGDKRENLDIAQAMAQRAIHLDAQNALGYFAAFQAYYHDGQLKRANDFAQRALALNPNDYAMLQYFALTSALRGDNEMSEAFDESSRRLIAMPPRWFDAARLTRLFAEGRDDDVLEQLWTVGVSDSVSLWFLRLAALGQAGRMEEGRAFFDSVATGPDMDIGNWLTTLRFWQPSEALEDRISEGWRKLGLDI